MKFRPKNQNDLAQLEDEQLIEYVVAARDAGDIEAISLAVYVFVYGRLPMIETMVALKTPPHVRDDLVATILSDVCISASRSFEGEHVGQFVNFIRTVTSRRIADHTDREKKRLSTDSLGPFGPEDDRWGAEPMEKPADPEGELLVKEAIERVMSTRSEEHRKVIALRCAGYPSKEVAERLPGLSVANIDQVFSRFGKDLRKALD